MTELQRLSPDIAYLSEAIAKIHRSRSGGSLNECKKLCLELIGEDEKFRKKIDKFLTSEYDKFENYYSEKFDKLTITEKLPRLVNKIILQFAKEEMHETSDKSRKFSNPWNRIMWDDYCFALNSIRKYIDSDACFNISCVTCVYKNFFERYDSVKKRIDAEIKRLQSDTDIWDKLEADRNLLRIREDLNILKEICEAYKKEFTLDLINSVVQDCLSKESTKFTYNYQPKLSLQKSVVIGYGDYCYNDYLNKDEKVLIPVLDNIFRNLSKTLELEYFESSISCLRSLFLANLEEAVSFIFKQMKLSENSNLSYTETQHEKLKDFICLISGQYLVKRVNYGQKYTFIDPYTNGRSYQSLRPLLDCDSFSFRYVTASNDIAKAIEDFHNEMRMTINKYADGTIAEYNRKNIKNPDPFHTLIVFDFPEGWKQDSIKNLHEIMRNGRKYGFNVFLHMRDESVNLSFDSIKDLAVTIDIDPHDIMFLMDTHIMVNNGFDLKEVVKMFVTENIENLKNSLEAVKKGRNINPDDLSL